MFSRKAAGILLCTLVLGIPAVLEPQSPVPFEAPAGMSIPKGGELVVSAYLVSGRLPQGGINVEPSARPWQYVGANPDGWFCPGSATCSNGADPIARINHELDEAAILHVANVRLEIPWFLVEPQRGVYDWSRVDTIFSAAQARGVQIQPILVYTPAWAGGYNAFPPAGDFQAFVAAFMARHGGQISAVEMWNEPDGGQSLASNDPASYVKDILIPGYTAVHSSGHPGVKVIEGGSINDAGGNPAWLNAIYANGGGNDFDIAAFHDYGGNYGTVVQAYESVLNAHGQGQKPIWMGEYGTSDASGSAQSSLILSAMSTPGLAMAQFYTLRDESVYKCCPPAPTGEHKQYGVLLADGVTRKTSFATLLRVDAAAVTNPPSGSPGPTP
ncbi:MAG: glycosyl hydrolase, partial [Candidatus Dormibacteraceae bacterium]